MRSRLVEYVIPTTIKEWAVAIAIALPVIVLGIWLNNVRPFGLNLGLRIWGFAIIIVPIAIFFGWEFFKVAVLNRKSGFFEIVEPEPVLVYGRNTPPPHFEEPVDPNSYDPAGELAYRQSIRRFVAQINLMGRVPGDEFWTYYGRTGTERLLWQLFEVQKVSWCIWDIGDPPEHIIVPEETQQFVTRASESQIMNLLDMASLKRFVTYADDDHAVEGVEDYFVALHIVGSLLARTILERGIPT